MSALAIAFRHQVVRPTLQRMNLWSEPAETLLMMTAAHESAGWLYCRQNGGPACGHYQMEPATLADLFNWLKLRPKWRDLMAREFQATQPQPDRLVFDSVYATACARMQYYRRPEPLPTDLDGLAAYAKRFWNTEAGKATPEKYRADFERYCQPKEN